MGHEHGLLLRTLVSGTCFTPLLTAFNFIFWTRSKSILMTTATTLFSLTTITLYFYLRILTFDFRKREGRHLIVGFLFIYLCAVVKILIRMIFKVLLESNVDKFMSVLLVFDHTLFSTLLPFEVICDLNMLVVNMSWCHFSPKCLFIVLMTLRYHGMHTVSNIIFCILRHSISIFLV